MDYSTASSCSPLWLLVVMILGDGLLVGGLMFIRRQIVHAEGREFDSNAVLLFGLFLIAMINVITFVSFLVVNPAGC